MKKKTSEERGGLQFRGGGSSGGFAAVLTRPLAEFYPGLSDDKVSGKLQFRENSQIGENLWSQKLAQLRVIIEILRLVGYIYKYHPVSDDLAKNSRYWEMLS